MMRLLIPVIVLLISLLAALVAQGCETSPRGDTAGQIVELRGVISGEILFRERIALPPDAVINTRLLERDPDGNRRSISERIMQNVGEPPIPFVLYYDPARTRAGSEWFVDVRITVADQEWFRSSGADQIQRREGAQGITIMVRWSR